MSTPSQTSAPAPSARVGRVEAIARSHWQNVNQARTLARSQGYAQGYVAGYVQGARWGLLAGLCWALVGGALAAWFLTSPHTRGWLPW